MRNFDDIIKTMFGFLVARYRRFLAALIVFVIVFLTIRLLLPTATVAYRTLYIISHVVPPVPEWFEWGSYEVETSSVGQIDLYVPKGANKTSLIIFVPGFNPNGARDSRMVNLARAFAGAGIGAAVPDSENIKQQKFSRKDIDLIKDTFYFLKDRPYVDSDRLGLSGFSIAGSYILRAASELGEEPLFVHSLGAYYDLAELFLEVKSEKVRYGDTERSWVPSSLSKEIASKDVNRDINKEELDKLSLVEALKSVKTRVYLMHDKNDDRIPVEHSRKIRDALPKDIPLFSREFSTLSHVTPRDLLSWDILRLAGQVFSIMKLLL